LFFLDPGNSVSFISIRASCAKGPNSVNKLIVGLATTAAICAVAGAPNSAAAETDANKTALQKATVECRAQVNQRHKMIKTCVKQALAKQ
jgi:hypothetical protein